jgi:hypothetical protein
LRSAPFEVIRSSEDPAAARSHAVEGAWTVTPDVRPRSREGLSVQDLPGPRHPDVPDQSTCQRRRLGREQIIFICTGDVGGGKRHPPKIRETAALKLMDTQTSQNLFRQPLTARNRIGTRPGRYPRIVPFLDIPGYPSFRLRWMRRRPATCACPGSASHAFTQGQARRWRVEKGRKPVIGQST